MATRSTITVHEEMRRRCGFTVTGLAERIGFSHSWVSKIEAGEARPSLKYMEAVSTALGIPIAVIFPESP